ncbi:hypothetical protein B5M09_008422 [Aphanomyces astaci]|uniref:Uncharacterized protein n=1 Tax=Aphanomyces astaci TaxID=112090 RepID=A0A3R7WMJ2_APHAT|nr:hypothetical protein B5M09_008422 [Aphanomyces astaci]
MSLNFEFAAMSPAPRSTRELTPGMKMEVVFALQDAIHNGKLARGFIQATAIRCQVGRTTVRKLWRDFMSGSMASKKKGRVGPKPRHTSAEVTEIVRSVPSIFLTLQAVMRLVMEHHGDKNFKLPHLKKDTLRRAGTLMANVTWVLRRLLCICVQYSILRLRAPAGVPDYNNAFNPRLDSATAIDRYRFSMPQLELLGERLGLPGRITTKAGDNVTRLESLSIICRRLSESSKLLTIAN